MQTLQRSRTIWYTEKKGSTPHQRNVSGTPVKCCGVHQSHALIFVWHSAVLHMQSLWLSPLQNRNCYTTGIRTFLLFRSKARRFWTCIMNSLTKSAAYSWELHQNGRSVLVVILRDEFVRWFLAVCPQTKDNNNFVYTKQITWCTCWAAWPCCCAILLFAKPSRFHNQCLGVWK